MFARLIPLALVLSACAPQNATLTSGEYFAFVSEDTSFSLQKGAVDPYDWDKSGEAYTIDCRTFDGADDKKARQLTGISSDCGPNDGDKPECVDRRHKKVCNSWIEAPRGDGTTAIRPEQETWMGQGAWWVLHEQLDPWRGEAVLTGEDDLQIGFHHRLPGGEDFRFYFAVDPDFAPQRCNIENGEAEPVDGDWITEWTAALTDQVAGSEAHAHLDKILSKGGSAYFLNSDGFQFNPDDTLDYWFLPEQWVAGSAGGKFSEEAFFSRSPRWGLNEIYEYFEVFDPGEGYAQPPGVSELYFCPLEDEEVPEDNSCWRNDDDLLKDIRKSIEKDMTKALSPGDEEHPWGAFSHNNAWRIGDGTKAGFDGWHELHYNVVVFDKTPDQMRKLEAGDELKGAFTLTLDGLDSASRWLVKGEFEAKIKKDRWVTKDLRAEKLEENGNSLCVLQ